jgi:hypothetical protein
MQKFGKTGSLPCPFEPNFTCRNVTHVICLVWVPELISLRAYLQFFYNLTPGMAKPKIENTELHGLRVQLADFKPFSKEIANYRRAISVLGGWLRILNFIFKL